jgi:hypothetical protein
MGPCADRVFVQFYPSERAGGRYRWRWPYVLRKRAARDDLLPLVEMERKWRYGITKIHSLCFIIISTSKTTTKFI